MNWHNLINLFNHRCQHQFEKDVNKMKLHEKLKEVDMEMNKEENEVFDLINLLIKFYYQ